MTTRKCLVCKKRFEVRSNSHWLCSAECAKVKNNEAVNKKKEQLKKSEWTKEKSELKINTHSKEYKKALQNEINKLSRMIDIKFGYDTCIDCGESFGNHQIDACHLISRKKNSTLKYHLHNLHSGHNHCNVYNEQHESNYKKGLINRYGSEYLTMVQELPIKHKEIHLNNNEIWEKLKLVRGIIRGFDTYSFTDSVNARNILNKLIGIYL